MCHWLGVIDEAFVGSTLFLESYFTSLTTHLKDVCTLHHSLLQTHSTTAGVSL